MNFKNYAGIHQGSHLVPLLLFLNYKYNIHVLWMILTCKRRVPLLPFLKVLSQPQRPPGWSRWIGKPADRVPLRVSSTSQKPRRQVPTSLSEKIKGIQLLNTSFVDSVRYSDHFSKDSFFFPFPTCRVKIALIVANLQKQKVVDNDCRFVWYSLNLHQPWTFISKYHLIHFYCKYLLRNFCSKVDLTIPVC